MEYQKITKVSRNSAQNNSKTVTNENDVILNEKYISPEERGEILEQKMGLKYTMNHEKRTAKVVKLDLKLQC